MIEGEFVERSGETRTRSIPLSHVSVELGHLYMEDLQAGPDRLRAVFAEAAPWWQAISATAPKSRGRTRISSCFMVDDYFSDLKSPAEVLPMVMDAAQAAGLRVDYLARESGCARTMMPEHGPVSPADLLMSRVVDEPVPGSTGGRPPVTQTGWLSNGRRSPSSDAGDAMDVASGWQPPAQTAARRHSIFVDVELWDGDGVQRIWSCPLLAAVWQLLRLGLIRHEGQPVAEPVDPTPGAPWPDNWAELPSVLRLNPKADPFFAYTTVSILSARFLPVELAVRTVLSQFWPDPDVLARLGDRAASEGLRLPPEVLDRIGYVFAGSGNFDPA